MLQTELKDLKKLQIINFKLKYLVNRETDLLRYSMTGLQSKKLPKHNVLPYLAQWKSKHGFNKSIREIMQTKNLRPHLKHAIRISCFWDLSATQNVLAHHILQNNIWYLIQVRPVILSSRSVFILFVLVIRPRYYIVVEKFC